MRDSAVAQVRKNTRYKHESIMQSASRLFLKNGYTHTSMDAIAADAGVSKQTVYSYFSNKELLFRCMIEELCNSNTPPESLLSNKALGPSTALFEIGRGFMETITSRTGLGVYRLVMAEGVRHPRVAELFYQSGPQKMQEMLISYLERQVVEGTLYIRNVDRAASHFFSMLKGWYQMRLLLKLKPIPSKEELEQHVIDTVAAFCEGYSAKHKPRSD